MGGWNLQWSEELLDCMARRMLPHPQLLSSIARARPRCLQARSRLLRPALAGFKGGRAALSAVRCRILVD